MGVKFILKKIKKICTEKHITIAALERELGFGNGSIRKWDRMSPSVERVSLVADYLGVNIEYLISDELNEFGYEEKQKFNKLLSSLTPEQKLLVTCYISLLVNNNDTSKAKQ